MPNDTLLPSFARFDQGCGKFDQAFQEIGCRSCTTDRVPNRLPRLVRFPAVAVVEQVNPAQVFLALLVKFRLMLVEATRLSFNVFQSVLCAASLAPTRLAD